MRRSVQKAILNKKETNKPKRWTDAELKKNLKTLKEYQRLSDEEKSIPLLIKRV